MKCNTPVVKANTEAIADIQDTLDSFPDYLTLWSGAEDDIEALTVTSDYFTAVDSFTFVTGDNFIGTFCVQPEV